MNTSVSLTPILDLAQEPPTPPKSRFRVLRLVLYACIGAAIGVMAPDGFGAGLPGFNGLLWFPFLYIAIAIHELAHLAVGKLTGMPPGGLIVGGFVLMKSGDRWNFRFDRQRIFSGGMAIPLPSKHSFRIDAFAWMTAAGPIASILTTLACWLAFMKYGTGTWDWIGSFFWASCVGLFSLIPFSAGLQKSDAARVLMLLKDPQSARAWMAAVAVQAENARGLLPHEWDALLVEQMLAASQKGGESVFRELMAYFRALDLNDEVSAFAHLELTLAASAKAGKAVRQALYFEAAETTALLKHNAANARVWRDRALKLRKPESGACVDGAIAIAEGRFEDALREIEKARAFLVKRKLDSGLARFAHQRLNERERECRAALSSALAKSSAST